MVETTGVRGPTLARLAMVLVLLSPLGILLPYELWYDKDVMVMVIMRWLLIKDRNLLIS